MKRFRIALLAAVTMILSGILIAGGLVDLNSSSAKDLGSLKGVGAVTAKKIIAARPYRSVGDLSKAGLTVKQISEISPFVTVNGASAPAAAPAPGATRAAKASRPAIAPSGPVDLNTASSKELEALSGVGAATAKKIIAARPYRSVAELSRAGLSVRQISVISPQVTVGAASSPAPAPVARAQRTVPATAGGLVNLNTASEKELDG